MKFFFSLVLTFLVLTSPACFELPSFDSLIDDGDHTTYSDFDLIGTWGVTVSTIGYEYPSHWVLEFDIIDGSVALTALYDETGSDWIESGSKPNWTISAAGELDLTIDSSLYDEWANLTYTQIDHFTGEMESSKHFINGTQVTHLTFEASGDEYWLLGSFEAEKY